MSESSPRLPDAQVLMQYAHDPSSIELKDIPRALAELELLRAELWSKLYAAAVTPRTPQARDTTFLTVAEVAARLKLSRGHVYELIRSGRLAAIRTGRAVRVPVAVLTELQLNPAARAFDFEDSVALSSAGDRRGRQTHPEGLGAHPAGVRRAARCTQSHGRQVGDGRSGDSGPRGQAHRAGRDRDGASTRTAEVQGSEPGR